MEEFAKWLTDHGPQITVVVPLIAFAGSAFAYIIKLFLDLADRRKVHFLELVALLDQQGTLAGKLAAVYQLSTYSRDSDKEFLVRLFDNRDKIIEGASADILKEEMRIAAEKLRSS